MRLSARHLPWTLLLGAACSQLIGLDEYETVDGPAGGRSGAGGEAGDSTNAGTGGSRAGAPNGAGAGGEAGDGGGGDGSGGDAGSGASAGRGGSGTGGTSGSSGSGGKGGSGGVGGGPVDPCRDELLVDGGFDLKSVNWTEIVRDGFPDVRTTERAHQGMISARVGGADGPTDPDMLVDSEIYQLVTIPPNTLSLTASCYAWIESAEDPASTTEWDLAIMSLTDPDLSGRPTLFELMYFSNLDENRAFQLKTATFVPGDVDFEDRMLPVGRRVAFELYSYADDSQTTSFYFDTCSLVARICDP